MTELGNAASGLLTRQAQVSTNGITLAYSEIGEGEPLLLIMGLGADRSAWDQHVAAFAGEYRCIAVDNRGAGLSDAPAGPYTTAQMADDYAGLLVGLGLQHARVVGISMGGAIAQQLAIRHPELVSKLVIVSSWARPDAYTREVFAQLRNARQVMAAPDFARLLQLLIWAPSSFDGRVADLLAERDAEPGMSTEAFLAQCDACASHDVIDRLGAIPVPTLVTVGSRDIFTPIELSEELVDLIPGAQLAVYQGAGHAHHWERLEEFNADVLRWLA
jgi:pimeloyl-ACP methyl ester carboxylesterase